MARNHSTITVLSHLRLGLQSSTHGFSHGLQFREQRLPHGISRNSLGSMYATPKFLVRAYLLLDRPRNVPQSRCGSIIRKHDEGRRQLVAVVQLHPDHSGVENVRDCLAAQFQLRRRDLGPVVLDQLLSDRQYAGSCSVCLVRELALFRPVT